MARPSFLRPNVCERSVSGIAPARLRELMRKLFRDIPTPVDELEERASLAALISGASRDGHMVICSGGTDCDGYSGESHTVIPATVTHFLAYRNRQADEAEGRWHCYIVTEADADCWAGAYDARDYAHEVAA